MKQVWWKYIFKDFTREITKKYFKMYFFNQILKDSILMRVLDSIWSLKSEAKSIGGQKVRDDSQHKSFW